MLLRERKAEEPAVGSLGPLKKKAIYVNRSFKSNNNLGYELVKVVGAAACFGEVAVLNGIP
eukprot:7032165-Pyramimonas_sp.AAC.1